MQLQPRLPVCLSPCDRIACRVCRTRWSREQVTPHWWSAGRPSLAEGAPAVAAQFHPTRNGNHTPQDVTCGSSRRLWWLCMEGKCSPGCSQPHEWRADPLHRVVRGQACPVCAGQQACSCNSITFLFPEVVQTSWDWESNEVPPEQLMPGSSHHAHWKCMLHDPPHRWQACVNMRLGSRKSGCPACANAQRRGKRAV